MKGRIITDWSKINWKSPEDVKKYAGALQHFMTVPSKEPLVKQAMQQFTTKGDFPANINAVLEKFHITPDWDNGFERIFDVRDFTGSNASGFDILDVSSGLTFAKVPTGDKAKIYKMTGAKVSVGFDKYGGGVGFDRVWFEDSQYWTIEDTAIEFRNKAFSTRAANFYALIEAVSSAQNLAWQGVTADTQVTRDIKTINKAALTILTALKDKGYATTVNTRLTLLAPLALRDRISAALTNLNQAFAGSPKSVQYTIEPVFTLMLAAQDKYYVTVPGVKTKAGYRMDLTLFNIFDPLSYADTVVGWMRYGGAIGDEAQFQRCSVA